MDHLSELEVDHTSAPPGYGPDYFTLRNKNHVAKITGWKRSDNISSDFYIPLLYIVNMNIKGECEFAATKQRVFKT